MSKGNALAIGMMSIAIIGLAIWNVQLSSQIDKQSFDIAETSEGPAGRAASLDAQKISAWEARLEAVERQATGLSDDLAGFRSRTNDVLADLTGGEVPAIDSGGVAPTTTAVSDVEAVVAAVIDKREEEERREQREQRANRMSRWLLRGVDGVTSEQQQKVGSVMMSYWDARRQGESELRERDATPQEIEVARERLAADRDLELQQVLNSAQFAQLSETLERMSRGGNRGGRRNR